MLNQIIEYISKTYNPVSIIVYGSYASKTNNLNSDFDSLVISKNHEQYHDTSFVNGVQLDVFVYPVSYFEKDFDCNDFIQIFDGIIFMDNDDLGKNLQNKVISFLENRPNKTKAELKSSVDWCAKMFERTKRGDAEGMFRWHWVLIDSLEIFCDIAHHPYLGPKKSLLWMKENFPEAFTKYKNALEEMNSETLENWVSYIETLVK